MQANSHHRAGPRPTVSEKHNNNMTAPRFYRFNRTLAAGLTRVNHLCGRAVAFLTGVMALIVALIVGARALGMGAIAAQELVTYCHAMVIMLAAGYTLSTGGHVRVDIFYHRFRPVTKAWVDALGSALLLLPLSGFMVLISWEYVAASWAIKETSADAGGIPAVYLLKSLIIANGGLLFLQGLAELALNLNRITYHAHD